MLKHHPCSVVVEVSFLLVFLASCCLNGVSGGCSKLESCHNEHQLGLEAAGIDAETFREKDTEQVSVYCAELKAYVRCIKKSTNACRGDLSFHSTLTLIETLIKRLKCSQNSAHSYRRPTIRKKPPQCTLISPGNYQHCGVFGDPHIKTFSRQYQTCLTQGAWPLINNKFLTVQVTNMPVINTSDVTSLTKVTVIIKSTTQCTSWKSYEATSESPLRPYFTDETSESGPNGSVNLTFSSVDGLDRVQIYLRYIDTTLVIRRIGDFLSFSCRMPEEIVESTEPEEIELCRNGCPSSEIVDTQLIRGKYYNRSAAFKKCTEARDNETYWLTDHYLDWCVFDLMTTGQLNFVTAALLAQADTMHYDPSSLNNRTRLIDDDDVEKTSKGTSTKSFLILIVGLIIFIQL